eukprot:90351_1
MSIPMESSKQNGIHVNGNNNGKHGWTQLISDDLYLNVAKHSITTNNNNNNNEITLPITRIEHAPGVMPNHIIPLIYNDNDSRWDSFSFWNIYIPSLPNTLLSFR